MSTVDVASIIQALVSVSILLITISNNYQIKIIHKATNSMKDELVSEVRTASFAKGRLDAQKEIN